MTTKYVLTYRDYSDDERPRRYDFYGRPVTGVVRASEHLTHSEVWSIRAAQTQLINRTDDLALMRNRPISRPSMVGNPRLRFTVRGDTVTRIA